MGTIDLDSKTDKIVFWGWEGILLVFGQDITVAYQGSFAIGYEAWLVHLDRIYEWDEHVWICYE